MKKKLISWLLLFVMLATTLPVFGAELAITSEETLMKGVTYRRWERLESNGWQDIHVITADLTEPHLTFDVLSHENGKSYLENPLESAKKSGAVAAVNADFFQTIKESGRGNAIGLEIADGEMKTSPAAYEQMNVLYQTKKNPALLFDMFTYEFMVTAPDDAATDYISVINKYDSMTGIVMYTEAWGEMTPGSAGNVFEMVVKNGKVLSKNRDVGPVEIPKNGYVLACDLGINTFLDDYFEEGDEVTLTMSTTPDYETIETAVGGGGMLLVNGELPDEYSHTISGTHPRTAVGVDKTGKQITLVVVDGRRAGAAGMTMPQLGALMQELGCYNAMNLDGGGSSLMAIKKDGEHIVANAPSDNYKRPVTNSIGILADTSGNRIYSDLRIKTDDTNVFAGTSLYLTPEFIDQFGLKMDHIPIESVKWSVEKGKGVIRNGFYYPVTPGEVTIRAEHDGKYCDLSLTVLDTPYRLTFSSSKLKAAPGSSQTLWLTGTDIYGNSAIIYPKDVAMSVKDSTIASIKDNAIKALTKGSTVISATLGNATAYASFTVGDATEVSAPKNKMLPDPQEKPAETAGNLTFTVFGNTRTPKLFFDLFIMNGVKRAVSRESDLNFFVGNGVDASLLEEVEGKTLADGYHKFKKGMNTFVTLKNAYGTSLFDADRTQWQKLQNEVKNLSGGNFFVFLNDHNLSPLQAEITVFKNLMAEAAKKADNVYVFAGGFVNETVIENGVRYITTAGVFPSIGATPNETSISYLKYYLITVNGNEVTYETKGIVK